MAKYFGNIGYGVPTEAAVGVWKDSIIERPYYGDAIRDTRKQQGSSAINDDLNISMVLSIVSDPYANENTHRMRYAWYMNAKWKIANIDVQYPRLLLTLGGVHNG